MMFDFIDTARDLMRGGRVEESRAEFELVFRAVASLQRVHSKAQLDLNNIEAVFTAFEMAQLIGALPGYSAAEIAALVPAMRVVITRTLEESLDFHRSIDLRSPPSPYYHFAELLAALHNPRSKVPDVSVITFNYDVAVDFALRRRFEVDYGFGSGVPRAMPVLKLHGSLNWFECKTCEQIVWWDLKQFTLKLTGVEATSSALPLKLSERFGEWEHGASADHDVSKKPVIVPPTWSKAEYHRALSPVWRRAALELRDAENIYVVGFSLPTTDEFFRYLYGLGTVGDTILQRFWVVDPDPSGAVEQRFRALLGPGAEQRFRFFKDRFSTFISKLKAQAEKSP